MIRFVLAITLFLSYALPLAAQQAPPKTRDNGMYWSGVALTAIGGFYVGWDLGKDHSVNCVTTTISRTAFTNCTQNSHNYLWYGLGLIGAGTAFEIAAYHHHSVVVGPHYLGYRKTWR